MPIRLTGMASGLDTDSIIKDLMKIESMKVDKQYQNKLKLDYKVEAYQSINSKLQAFSRKFATALSGGMLSQSVYKRYDVKFSGASTNQNFVEVTANSTASDGYHTINQVDRLASADTVSGNIRITGDDGDGMSIYSTLEELDTALQAEHGAGAAFQWKDKMSGPLLDANGDPLLDGNGDPVPEVVVGKEMSFTINGEEFTFDSKTSINKMINEVNSNTDANVVMSYSQLTDTFKIESRVSGKDSELTFSDNIAGATPPATAPGGNFFAALGILDKSTAGSTFSEGVNAQLTIDGVQIERSSNNFEIDGINYKLLRTTNQAVDFSLSQNVDESMEQITSFINEYNDLIKELNGLVSEKTYRKYKPLTEEERDSLTEKEAEEWDAKAKSGVLRNDSGLQGLLGELRGAFYSTIDGLGKMGIDIGLETSANYMDGGTITINESKLREALQTDPEGVYSVFTKSSSSTNAATKYNESGIVNRISISMNNYIDTNEETTLYQTEQQQETAAEKYQDMLDKLAEIEENYYMKFSAMETAMAKMQSQLQGLSSMMGR